MRPSWDEYFLEIAITVSLRGDCTRSKVGAVLVDHDHVIITTGYNGVHPGTPGCLDGACPRGQKGYDQIPPYGDYGSCISVHAEGNALRFASLKNQGYRLPGAVCYITRGPCDDCVKLLKWASVSRIKWPGYEMVL